MASDTSTKMGRQIEEGASSPLGIVFVTPIYMENLFNTDYNHCSDSLCAIAALGVQQTRWNNIHHDTHPNQQKLYCRLTSGEEVVLKCEYSDCSALIAVHEPHRFKGIGNRAPHLIEPVLTAIQTEYPLAEIVGEERFIRVVF